MPFPSPIVLPSNTNKGYGFSFFRTLSLALSATSGWMKLPVAPESIMARSFLPSKWMSRKSCLPFPAAHSSWCCRFLGSLRRSGTGLLFPEPPSFLTVVVLPSRCVVCCPQLCWSSTPASCDVAKTHCFPWLLGV